MSSEVSGGLKRSSSSATRSGHLRAQSRATPQPKSSHTSDDFLKSFLNPSFDPASYLNSTLPPLARRQAPSQAQGDAVPLAELSAQAQTLTSQINAHTTRLSNTLTQLTDEILRSGSRLAYKVELLRGETLSLTETLHERLQDDINTFIPEGLQDSQNGLSGLVQPDEAIKKTVVSEGDDSAKEESLLDTGSQDPDYIQKLRTLTIVRSRLDSVIKTFGDAMEFVFPPSEVSVGSGFLSVSAPEPGSEQQSSEAKGQMVLQNLRTEISHLLKKSDDPIDGIAKAASRIEQLKELSTCWNGTAEENGRNKFIDSLAKMVEDRHKELTKEMEQAAKKEGKPAGATHVRKGSLVKETGRKGEAGEDSKGIPGGFGLINQLQRLRTGLN